MSDNTKIEWADATWNPITGCSIVDSGCTNCYAMQLAGTRLKHHPSRAGLTRETGGRPKWTGEVRFNREWLDQPLRWSKPRMIFVCALGDLFHESVPDEWIDRVFAVMALAPQHTFQVLTKRPDRAARYLESLYAYQRSVAAAAVGIRETLISAYMVHNAMLDGFKNVWFGASASDQASADLRIPQLLECPAATRFISYEPLLGPVQHSLDGIDWAIVGGESGRNARPMHPAWAASLRDQCVAAGVPFFFKQNGMWLHEMECGAEMWDWDTAAGVGHVHKWTDGTASIRLRKSDAGRLLDGRTWDEMPK